MKFNKTILAAAILAVPVLAFAADNNMSAGMQEPVADVKAAAEKSAKPGCPMIARGSRQGMMGEGMGMQDGRGGIMMRGSQGGMPGMS